MEQRKDQGHVGHRWCKQLLSDAIPSGIGQHNPSVSLDLLQQKNWCRSEDTHWQLRDLSRGKEKCFPFHLSSRPSSHHCSTGCFKWLHAMVGEKIVVNLLKKWREHFGALLFD